MRKIFALAVVALMTAIGAQAQKIEVVDVDGNGILVALLSGF